MKKRWIMFAAAILLALLPAAMAGAQAEPALLTKMQKQIGAGSGFKGSVTLTGLPVLGSLAVNVQHILQKEQSQTLLSFKSGEAELMTAALFMQDGMLALDPGLSTGKRYGFQGGLETLLTGLASENAGGSGAAWPSALYSILYPKDDKVALRLTEAAAPYMTKVDFWMQGFADPTALEKDANGVSVMKASYHIPVAAMKAELKQLLVDLLGDETLLPLLWEQVTEEQANLYLNPALKQFYFMAVDALPLEGAIAITRRVSTMGKLMDTTVTMPLSGTPGGIKEASFTVSAAELGDAVSCWLKTEKGTWSFSWKQIPSIISASQRLTYAGYLRYLPNEVPNWQVDSTAPQYDEKALSVAWQASLDSLLSTDADGKSSETYTVTLDVNPDWSHIDGEASSEVKALYTPVEPTRITAAAVLKSGQARNSATSLDFNVRIAGGVSEIKLDGQLKTAPPWSFTPIDISSVIPWEQVTPEERNAILLEILSKPGLFTLLPSLLPQNQEIPGTVG